MQLSTLMKHGLNLQGESNMKIAHKSWKDQGAIPGKENPRVLIYQMCPFYCLLFQMPSFLLNFLLPLCWKIQTFCKLTKSQSGIKFDFKVYFAIPNDWQYLLGSFFLKSLFIGLSHTGSLYCKLHYFEIWPVTFMGTICLDISAVIRVTV